MQRIFLLIVSLMFIIRPANAQNDLVTISIFNTADEHGWLQPFIPFRSTEVQGGAANIYSWWVEVEGYNPATDLLLSGGDNWTGPSISTWFQGQPLVQAFNMMGYDASAIGNHEFDFGRDVMMQRFSEANYPYLAANIHYADSSLPDFATPYVILETQGVKVGIIGLITRDTYTTTHPKNISDLVFTDYAEAIETFVPQMEIDGAQIVIALTHVCTHELITLAHQVGDAVDVMFAGHCNEFATQTVNGVEILASGNAWRSYAHLTITFDRSSNQIVMLEPEIVEVKYDENEGNPVTPNAELAMLVDEWQAQTDSVLAQPIGYTATGIEQRSDLMGNWVADAWLWAYPSADVAITNWGGFRQAINPGVITWGDIVGVMPFENRIYEVEITGEQLAANLKCCGGAVGGISYRVRGNEVEIIFLDGRDFNLSATYQVLVSDFMFAGGDNYLFGLQDPEPYDTSIQWRQPVIDYTASLNASEANPLENFLDSTPRTR